MKNKLGLLFALVVIFGFILYFLNIVSAEVTGNISDSPKVDGEIVDQLNSGEPEVSVIVNLKDSVSDYTRESIVKRVDEDNSSVEFSSGGFAVEVTKSELASLIADSRVNYIEPVVYFHAFLSEATTIINATRTWPLQISGVNLTGINQTVCIIDTGINYTHSDLSGRNATGCNIDCTGGSCVENCSTSDLNGHGTHVAGIVAASGNVNGVARGVNFIGVKVFPGSGTDGSTTTMIKNALDWCVDNSDTYNISVISMSLGTTDLFSSSCDSASPSFTNSVSNAFDKNISVVAATGNDANTTAIAFPSCISEVIPVGDTYDANLGGLTWGSNLCTDATTSVDKIVCHANRNSLVKLFAPGALINSTWFNGGYNVLGGTSMATPMVSGTIAIINQVLKATSQKKTPLEIEDILNSTGKTISDSGSGLSFSRINVYNAVLNLDNIAPNVALISPANGGLNISQNQTFVCNSSDWQLSNVTFYLWNSSNSLVYNETKSISGVTNQSVFNKTNLELGEYKWTCKAFDVLGNNFIATNFTVTVGGVSVSLISPENNSQSSMNAINFTCNSSSETTHQLSNVTFYLWNSSNSLVYNLTSVKTGVLNSSIFNFTFLSEGGYAWDCKAINNVSNYSYALSNYTFRYDITPPMINLSGVSDTTSTTIAFIFNVSDTNDISNCSVYVDGSGSLNSSAISKSQSNMISVSLGVGGHSAYVNCTDKAGNIGNSSTISFTISPPPVVVQQQSSGGGGGGGVSGSVYTINSTQASLGYTNQLKKDDKIKFEIYDENLEKHTLTIDKIGTNFVDITIQSEITRIMLGIGQSIKLNLTSKDYYSLYIKLNNIVNGKADITIQTIHEPIPLVVGDSNMNETNQTNTESEKIIIYVRDNKVIIYSVVLSLIIVLAVYLTMKLLRGSSRHDNSSKINRSRRI